MTEVPTKQSKKVRDLGPAGANSVEGYVRIGIGTHVEGGFKPFSPWTDAVMEQIMARLEAGHTVSGVARDHGITPNRMRHVIKRHERRLAWRRANPPERRARKLAEARARQEASDQAFEEYLKTCTPAQAEWEKLWRRNRGGRDSLDEFD